MLLFRRTQDRRGHISHASLRHKPPVLLNAYTYDRTSITHIKKSSPRAWSRTLCSAGITPPSLLYSTSNATPRPPRPALPEYPSVAITAATQRNNSNQTTRTSLRFRMRNTRSSSSSVICCRGALTSTSSCLSLASRRICSAVIWIEAGARFFACTFRFAMMTGVSVAHATRCRWAWDTLGFELGTAHQKSEADTIKYEFACSVGLIIYTKP